MQYYQDCKYLSIVDILLFCLDLLAPENKLTHLQVLQISHNEILVCLMNECLAKKFGQKRSGIWQRRFWAKFYKCVCFESQIVSNSVEEIPEIFNFVRNKFPRVPNNTFYLGRYLSVHWKKPRTACHRQLLLYRVKQCPASFMFIYVISTFQFKWQIYNLNYLNWKSLDVVFGIWTRGRRMVGADNSTELWRPPWSYSVSFIKNILQNSEIAKLFVLHIVEHIVIVL